MKPMPPSARARRRPAASAKPVALSEADVAALREKLESGKKPRVTLLVDTAHGPAGTSVPIVSFGEPAVGEFISVKLRDDVVPFSPAELSIPVRGRPAASTLPLDSPPGPQPVPPAARPYKPAKAEDTTPAARLVAVPEPPAELPVATPPPAPAPVKAAGRKPTRGGMSVTLRFNGQAWMYESTRGGRKSSARPLNLAAVRAFTDRLDDPALQRDMQVAIDVCRQQAQTRADALRAELERVEVELAELDE
jgi:hypothetical protein